MCNTVKWVFCSFCKKCPLLNSVSGCVNWHHQAAGATIDSLIECKEEIYFHYLDNWGIPKECLGRSIKSEIQAPLNSVHARGLLACYSHSLIKNYFYLQGHLSNVQSSSSVFCYLTQPPSTVHVIVGRTTGIPTSQLEQVLFFPPYQQFHHYIWGNN